MDVGAVVIGLIALLLVILVALAIRKMARGQLHEASLADALVPGETKEDLEALEKEALEAGPEGTDATPRTERRNGDGTPGTQTPPVVPPPVEGEAAPRKEGASAAEERAPMRRGLEKTRKGFMSRINEILFKGKLDEGLADELEAILVASDIGIRTAERLLGDLRAELTRKEISDPEVVRTRLRTKIGEIVSRERPPIDWGRGPTVVMVIGVNGVGKTTTIGKLAAHLVQDGKKVVLAAGDTFRAAAVEQLEIWGQRSGAEVVKGPEHGDPAAVVFAAIQRAQSAKADVCLCDTAGRLHTKVNLMEELKKLRRVMNKAMPGAPHEVLLVLDATTGQNAIAQAKQFKEAVEVNSIALTKLDGTAKGGVVVAICDDLGLPVRYVGIGEKVEDLRDFDPGEFVDALFAQDSSLDALPRAG